MLQLCQLGTVQILNTMLKWKLVKKRVETELLFPPSLLEKKNYKIVSLLKLICI